MSGKEKAPQGRAMGPFREGRKDRADQSQPQYSLPAKNLKNFDVDKHIKAARRAMGDAVVMLSGWPACIRYSYFVGSDGKLITRAERRAGI